MNTGTNTIPMMAAASQLAVRARCALNRAPSFPFSR
jgi:hypothetical protein